MNERKLKELLEILISRTSKDRDGYSRYNTEKLLEEIFDDRKINENELK